MNEIKAKDFESIESLISWLNKKYYEPRQAWRSSARFNVTLIFFHGKKAYHDFLNQAPFPKLCLSEKLSPVESTLNCSHAQKWLDEALLESKDAPQIILPITEYIRFCSQYNDRILDEVFNTLLQADNDDANFIVPMLDYYAKYKKFFEEYVHRDRMADVCSVNITSPWDERVIELVLDNSGQVPSESFRTISTVVEWVKLWETGDIADESKIIVHDPKIIRALASTDINIPKVDRIIIRNNEDCLSFLYNIDQSVFTLEPNKKVWEYVFSFHNGKNNDQISWNDIVRSALGPEIDFDSLCFELWEASMGKKKSIERWFWLNEAKKNHLNSEFLNYCVKNCDDPEMLLDTAWMMPLENPESTEINHNILSERRKFFKRFVTPLFKYGLEENERIFLSFIDRADIPKKLDFIVGLFDFEKRYLLTYAVNELRNNDLSPISEKISYFKDIWPTLGIYLESSLPSRSKRIPDITQNFELFVEEYFAEYISAKLLNDAESEHLKQLQTAYRSNFVSILAKVNTRSILSLSDPSFINKIHSSGFIFADGIGYEWYNVVKYLLEAKGWAILNSGLVLANLPTDTAHSGVNTEYFDRINSFDNLLHATYQYPDTIFHQLTTLEQIVNNIHEKFKSRKDPLYIISDHGATVFARKGRCIALEEGGAQSSGRYTYFSNNRVAEKEHVYITEDGKGKVLVSLNYDNFDKSAPKGEAHGGGTLEEICTFFMLVSPCSQRKVNPDAVTLESDKPAYTPFDTKLELLIGLDTAIQTDSLQLRINHGPLRSIPIDDKYTRKIRLSIADLSEKGLTFGENVIEIILNGKYIGQTTFKYQSGSEKTDFDDEFDL